MRQILPALVLGLLLAPAALAATPPKAGTYEVVSFPATGQGAVVGLVKITPKDGGVEGELVAFSPNQRGLSLKGVTLDGDTLRITLQRAAVNLEFEGRVPQAEADTVRGSLSTDGRVTAARIAITDNTTVTAATVSADEVDALRQTVTKLRQAGKDKADANQARDSAVEVLKAAQPYGPRYENEVVTLIAETLAPHGAYASLAAEYARRAETALTAKDSADQQLRVLNTLALALKVAGRPADAAVAESRAGKIIAEIDRQYLATTPPFKPSAFEGRKGQSDRVTVMELFTGAQCGPCVAADVAFDALEKTYKHTDVVLLQYHLHIPGPDPMTNAATESRARYYGVSGTPSTFFNGKREASGGGAMAASETKYKQYRGILERLMEEPAKATVKLGATHQGDTITFRADVSALTEPGEDKKLRLLLVEETVRFTGNNKLRYHHMVVRAMPGGPDGMALTTVDSRNAARVNLGELRQELAKYLDNYALNGARRPFPQPERPLAFANLKAIALVQDDKTKEILQAALVDVGGDRAGH